MKGMKKGLFTTKDMKTDLSGQAMNEELPPPTPGTRRRFPSRGQV
jgi:hypothetical protein